MSDTPRTDAATRMAFSGEYMVEIEEAQKMERDLTQSKEANAGLMRACDNLERELDEAKERMLNNPFCSSCKESNCCVSGDGTCAMIRKYLTADETTKQRDALAEALEHMLTHGETHQPPLRDTISNIALQALAATKGGQHE
jgi:hypothetical protein